MATIKCTFQEYHQFIGPRLRNAVNSLTRNVRNGKRGICEHCGKLGELDSAHIHGKERRVIIEEVLKDYSENGIIFGDLNEIENRILKAHQPVEEIFKFLCKSCHSIYDNNTTNLIFGERNQFSPTPLSSITSIQNFQKINRIKRWAGKSNQDNHKIIKAYLELARKGNVTLDTLKSKCSSKVLRSDLFVEKFDGHFSSMKTDNGNSHGKVFYEENGFVKVYSPVMIEIKNYFVV